MSWGGPPSASTAAAGLPLPSATLDRLFFAGWPVQGRPLPVRPVSKARGSYGPVRRRRPGNTDRRRTPPTERRDHTMWMNPSEKQPGEILPPEPDDTPDDDTPADETSTDDD